MWGAKPHSIFLTVKVPVYNKTVLGNGVRIVSSTMPHTRAVCICIFIGVGSRYEEGQQAGLSHFIEHLCFKGTERRPTAKEISEAIDGVGGVLNGGTDKELTVYWAKVARPHFLLALDLLVDMLRNSKFDSVDMENERKVIIEELNMCMDSPQSRVDMLIDEVMWPAQPLGRDVAGSKETVTAIGRDMILDYLPVHYLPSNTVVGVAGDITHDEVVDSVASMLGDWTDGTAGNWFPADNEQVKKCKPIYREFTGWTEIDTDATALDDLPKEAQKYLQFIENETGIPIALVSIGPGRTETIER